MKTFWAEIFRLFRLRSLVVWWRTLDARVQPVPALSLLAYASPDAVVAYQVAMATMPNTTTADLEVIDPTGEVLHEGANDEWAREVTVMVAKHEPLNDDIKRALTTDTGEFDTVALMVEEDADDLFGEPGPAPSWLEDELGYWDPDAVNWEAPAIFREVALGRLKAGELTPINLSEADFVDAIMRRILEPAR